MSSAPAAEISPGAADPRRMAVGLNGYSMVSERTTYGPREELVPRYIPDRFAAQESPQERNVNFGNRDLKNPDRSFDRSVVTSPTPRMEGAAVPQNVPSENLPEDRLKDMSIAAIKEFYRYLHIPCMHLSSCLFQFFFSKLTLEKLASYVC